MPRDFRFGPKLPVAPPLPPAKPCARTSGPKVHGEPIRFGLMRYGRTVGTILLCGDCFTELNPRYPVDPLDVTEAA